VKTVLFARHADSTWDKPEWTDRSRPLNARGLQEAPKMAALLGANAQKPDIILSSPANRAQSTAQFYAAGFGLPETAIIVHDAIYEAYPKTIWDIVQNLDNQYNTVMIVGHNPAMTYLLHDVGTAEYYANLSPAGVFQVAFSIDNWQNAMPQTAFLEHLWSIS
jgi:phosphohistidine phosphatase